MKNEEEINNIIEKVFKRYSKDKNILNLEEAKSFFEDLFSSVNMEINDDTINSIFKLIDKDNSNSINKKELFSIMNKFFNFSKK